jgi:putative phosphoesterase
MPVSQGPITFGVLADTHIPDRAKSLSDAILNDFSKAHVDRILHAGDSANWKVVQKLDEIAPVMIVQGNRDWLLGLPFPRHVSFSVHGIKITLAHGHRSMVNYLVDKWATIWEGYRFERYYQHLVIDFPDSDVIIFGHTHHQTAKWVKGKLFFNPGAAYPCKYNHYNPQYGILSITPEGIIRTACYGGLHDRVR